MPRPVVVVDGKELNFLAVTSLIIEGKPRHFVHCVDPKTHEIKTVGTDEVVVKRS